MNEKIHGKIKWYKKEKGYGYIIGEDDDTYFFEIINCTNLKENFNKDDRVLFVPNFGEFSYATKVEKAVNNE